MANTQRLIKLFQAIGAADMDAVRRASTDICADEDKKGHRTAARLLRSALAATNGASGRLQHSTEYQSTLPISSALTRLDNQISLADVELRPKARTSIAEVIAEWAGRNRLAAHNLLPRNKLFFFGPPGCGKSLTASALGAELGLPTFITRFDAIIGAYLGQTAIHLRQLFAFAEATPCVLVLDELDALGKRRGNPLDVGELDRIVISLMQELEHSAPQGLIIATSNLPDHIDDALWRRFDLTVEFPKPTRRELARYADRLARQFNITLSQRLLSATSAPPSFAECRKAVESEARRSALA